FAEYEKNCASDRCRMIRETENLDVNSLTYEFFRLCRSKGFAVSGPMLQVYAKKIADAIGVSEFAASNGWLESFRRRHNISFKVICGESNDVNSASFESRKER